MNNKDEFTRLLKIKMKLANETPTPVENEQVVDGCGAIVKTASNSYAYDLRLLDQKGLLPQNHPVFLAAQCEKEIKSSNKSHEDLERLEIIQQIKSEFSFSFFQMVETSSVPDSFLTLFPHSLFHWPDKQPAKLALRGLVYANPQHLLPRETLDCQLDSLALVINNEVSLLFSKNKLLAKMKSTTMINFYHKYLSFLHHVIINKGNGRLAAIERLLKEKSRPEWKVRGSYLLLPSGHLQKQDFLQEGLLVGKENFISNQIMINIPLSVYDLQIEDILNKLEKITGK